MLTQHPDLLRWSEAEPKDETPGLDLLDVLQGGRMGLHIPAYRYGQAGSLVSALLKSRLYAALKQRADQSGKTHLPVVFLLDEAQEIATDEDATLLAIGRSLGLCTIAATQTVEGVIERLGEEMADKWLGIYGSVVALTGRSPRTDEFVAARAGNIWRALPESVAGLPVRDTMRAQIFSGLSAAKQKQPYMEDTEEGGLLAADSVGRALARLGQNADPHPAFYLRLGALPLIDAGEMPQLLAEPETALALVTRGRVIWRDVIRLKPAYANAEPAKPAQEGGSMEIIVQAPMQEAPPEPLPTPEPIIPTERDFTRWRN